MKQPKFKFGDRVIYIHADKVTDPRSKPFTVLAIDYFDNGDGLDFIYNRNHYEDTLRLVDEPKEPQKKKLYAIRGKNGTPAFSSKIEFVTEPDVNDFYERLPEYDIEYPEASAE